jgi:cytochrome c oxidase subunit II
MAGDLFHHGAGIGFVFGHFSWCSLAGVANATLKRGRWFLLVAGMAALAGCAGPLSTLDPAGPAAGSIAWLWWVMLAGAAVLALLVFGLLAFVCFKPGEGARIRGTHWIVYGGLVMPVIVLTALVGYALFAGERLLAHPNPDVPRVAAQGEMWVWRFSYPDSPDAAETDVLHIPAGQPVDVVVTSTDVIHSFWVPRLAGKIDAVPGHENVVRIEADRPGTYNGVCAEFCGMGHTDMRFVVMAHDPAEYEAALAGDGQ